MKSAVKARSLIRTQRTSFYILLNDDASFPDDGRRHCCFSQLRREGSGLQGGHHRGGVPEGADKNDLSSFVAVEDVDAFEGDGLTRVG